MPKHRITPEEFEESEEDFPADRSLKYRQHKKKKTENFTGEACPPQKMGDLDTSVSPIVVTLDSSDSYEKSDVPSTSPSTNKDLQALISLSSTCKEHLMRVVSTAVQFQRHSHHPKLCSSHFSKALALEDLSYESDDSDDFADLKMNPVF